MSSSVFFSLPHWLSNWESSGLFLGGWTSQINGDSSKAGLAEGGINITADLPPVNSTQCQVRLLPPRLTQALCLPLCVFTVMWTLWSLYFWGLGKCFSLWTSQCFFCYIQVFSPESINDNQAPSSADFQNCITSTSSSVYPCTSTVNPTIVLLQHNRGEHSVSLRWIFQSLRVCHEHDLNVHIYVSFNEPSFFVLLASC